LQRLQLLLGVAAEQWRAMVLVDNKADASNAAQLKDHQQMCTGTAYFSFSFGSWERYPTVIPFRRLITPVSGWSASAPQHYNVKHLPDSEGQCIT
jgi:hypothetical protein